MTNKNAIEIIDNILSNEKIKNRLDSEDIDRLREAKLVIRKQIPKKPILKEYGFFGPYPFCSWCDNALINTRNDSWHKEKFCPNCGQALDWSDIK